MTHPRQVVLALLLVLSVFAGWPAPVPAAQLDPAVRDAVVPAAVQIAIVVTWKENTFARDYPVPLGSGTIVSPDGLILTNQHVVERTTQRDLVAQWQQAIAADAPGVELVLNESKFAVLGSDGVHPPLPRYQATLVRDDRAVDLAVLRINGDAAGAPIDLRQHPVPFVPIGESSGVRLGDRVHLFAFPAIGGDALTYTEGVVSGFRYDDRADQPNWIMTDAVMSGGSSGGTAVDAAGRLIGVPTQGSKLDCRPGDTNGDGEVTAEDVGCIPTGG
ncbi:MAG TPA: serine protease, partial [Thermomicrobiales bacterium]|nr:serine protease [Thermomicrobiales bacterium]